MALEIPVKLIEKAGAHISKEISKNIERYTEELRRGLKAAETERKNVETGIFSVEDFIENIRERHNNEIALERNPSKLCRDITKRLLADKGTFGEAVWKNADLGGRKAMFKKMLEVIGEEMELPSGVRKNLRLDIEELPGAEGATNLFVRLNEKEQLVLDENTVPRITLHSHLFAPDASMLDALEVLFHESLHVMQQVSVTETEDTFLHTSLRKLWDNEIREACRTHTANLANQSFEDYITSEMEAFPHAYDDYLIEVYRACEAA